MSLVLLTVDDHASVTTLMSVVAQDDHRYALALVASTVEEAREVVSRHRPDLILLDARLGGEDGLSLIGELRAKAPNSMICVVSSEPYVDAAVAGRAGADAFFPKGTDPDRLLDAGATFRDAR